MIGRFAWTPEERPDGCVLRSEAERLAGERDFRLFRNGTEDRSTVRTLTRAEVREDRGAIYLTVEANAFLRGMIRWTVAALWARATGGMDEEQFTAMLEGRSRPATLTPAPPQGLCLVRVRY
jgi:tRNA pseudouridine38-40 synthase